MTRIDDLKERRAYHKKQVYNGLWIEWGELDPLLDCVDAAQKVDEIYEGLRTDATDGEFSLWSEDDLVAALHALRPALAALNREPA
jgi:hypothetical protein